MWAFCKEYQRGVQQGRQNNVLDIYICHGRPIRDPFFVGIMAKSLRQDTAINSMILQKVSLCKRKSLMVIF